MNKHAQINKKQSAGFTLVELMIAMVIGLAIIIGMTEIWSTSYRAKRTAGDISSLQDSTRALLSLIKRDFMMAGHTGCYSSNEPILASPADPSVPGSTLNVARDALQEDSSSGSTVYTIMYAEPQNLLDSITVDSVIFSGAGSPEAGSSYLISSCEAVQPFTVASGAGSGKTVKLDEGVSPDFAGETPSVGLDRRGLQLLKVNQVTYSWEDSTANYADGDSIGRVLRNGDELLRGVAHFEIQYGVRASGTSTLVYHNALTGLDRREIESVRVDLAFRPAEHATDELELHQCMGVDAVSCSSTVVLLRNDI